MKWGRALSSSPWSWPITAQEFCSPGAWLTHLNSSSAPGFPVFFFLLGLRCILSESYSLVYCTLWSLVPLLFYVCIHSLLFPYSSPFFSPWSITVMDWSIFFVSKCSWKSCIVSCMCILHLHKWDCEIYLSPSHSISYSFSKYLFLRSSHISLWI